MIAAHSVKTEQYRENTGKLLCAFASAIDGGFSIDSFWTDGGT